MMIYKSIFFLFLASSLFFIPLKTAFSGDPGFPVTFSDTDNNIPSDIEGLSISYVFDLRDRETFLQFTYPQRSDFTFTATAHIQIFNVADNCNENNFFDVYTVNDTHVYNMRDIITNDGNPSGVVLPDGAYGIVVITLIGNINSVAAFRLGAIGNVRIMDVNGYEYRTNAQQVQTPALFGEIDPFKPIYTFNYNANSGVTLSDVMGVTLNFNDEVSPPAFVEWDASDPITAFISFDIDIVDNNEIIFSCRDITFACVNQDHPLLEELLAESGTSIASFEYGINNAIPHSKDGELLCPGNIISEGIVTLNPELQANLSTLSPNFTYFLGFVGLNNGNGRGSFDSFWYFNFSFGTG